METGPMWPPASMPSITSASAPERISFFASARAGAKQTSLAPLPLIRSIAPPRRKAAGEDDVADIMLGADIDQLRELRVHGDEVDAERAVRAHFRLGDLGVEQLGSHRAAGDHTEAAGIGDGGDEVALADPAHRAAHDRDVAAKEFGAAVHQLGEALMAFGRMNRARLGDSPSPLTPPLRSRGRRRCGALGLQARDRPRRSTR